MLGAHRVLVLAFNNIAYLSQVYKRNRDEYQSNAWSDNAHVGNWVYVLPTTKKGDKKHCDHKLMSQDGQKIWNELGAIGWKHSSYFQKYNQEYYDKFFEQTLNNSIENFKFVVVGKLTVNLLEVVTYPEL